MVNKIHVEQSIYTSLHVTKKIKIWKKYLFKMESIDYLNMISEWLTKHSKFVGDHSPFTKYLKQLSLVKILFNSRRTSIWITFVFSIFAEVRFKEFSVLQTAKGPFFDILTFLGARRLILVNMSWPNVFQINLTWKFTSRGTENVFESCSYLQYSRSYNQKNFECYSPLRDTTAR